MRWLWRGALDASLLLVLLAPSSSAVAAPATVEAEGYLVAPFENDSGVKSLDWMASALAVTVAEKLEALPALRPVYGPAVIEGWPERFDEPKALERAREAGARWVVVGSFARPDWNASVKLRILQVTDGGLKEVATSTNVGKRDDLLAVLDQTLDAVVTQQKWMPEGDALALLHRRPTKDLYAFTLFGRALNQLYGIGAPQSGEQAQKTLQRTTHIDPKFAEAHRLLGVVYLGAGEDAKAAGQYAYALDLKPNYYAAIAGLARLYRAENKKQPAREMADKALAARPWDVEMRLLVGTLEAEAGELDRALADLKQVVAARPKMLAAQRTLAQLFSTRGDIEELAEQLGRVAELAPDDVEVKLDMASAWMRLGKNDKAIAAYEDVLRRQPKNLSALKFTGDLYRRVGDPQRAIVAYERVRHLAPEDPRPYFLLGAAYAEAGKDEKAMAVLEDAQQFKAYVGEAWTDLGAIHLRRGDIDKATWYLSRAVTRAPMRPKAHFNYALVLDAAKQRDKALAELKLATDLDPEDPESHYLAGVILLRMGRLEDAKGEFGEALRIKPSHADAKHNLALLEDLDRRYGAEHAGIGAQ